ncbi:MAG TPA: hypothetical protein VFR37_13755 [Longimicrobium sp.]|nr:hypothetical protein [Longimicrobium sp.]
MRVRMTGLAALLAVGTTACDPVYTMDVRQSLVPSPAADCVVNAVSGSAHVAEVRPRGEDVEANGYLVLFRDVRSSAVLTDRPAPDPGRVVTLSYTWLAATGHGTREMQRMRTAAENVLADVRAACAPESSTPPECVLTTPSSPRGPCPAA